MCLIDTCKWLVRGLHYIIFNRQVRKFIAHCDNAPQHFRTNDYLRGNYTLTLDDSITREVAYHGKYHGKTVGDSAGGNFKTYLDTATAIHEMRDIHVVAEFCNKQYLPIKRKCTKTTIRKIFAVDSAAVRSFRINRRLQAVPALKSHFSYLFVSRGYRQVQAYRRLLTCVCHACAADRFDECVGIDDNAVLPIFE